MKCYINFGEIFTIILCPLIAEALFSQFVIILSL